MSLQYYFQYKRLQRAICQQLEHNAHLKVSQNTDSTNSTTPSKELRDQTHPTWQLDDSAALGSTDADVEKRHEAPHFESDEQGHLVVKFDGDHDMHNPKNWSLMHKIRACAVPLAAGIVGGWASSNDSMIIPQAQEDFCVSDVAESLSTGLYLVSFGLGSLMSGPFSEAVGRSPVYLTTVFLIAICLMVSGLAPNLGVQLAFRFLAGWFGCTAVTTYAGTTADLWSPKQRCLAFMIPSAINFIGIFLSPTIGGFIGQSSLSWRWTEWVVLILAGVATILVFFFCPETSGPIILSWKAAILRKETGNPQFRSEHELKPEPLWRRLHRSTYRPFNILIHELPVILFTLYLTVIYVVSFTFLTGYTFIYGDIYHMSQGSVGLCFLALDVGIIIITLIGVLVDMRYNRNLRAAEARGQPFQAPEERLWLGMIAAPCLPIGLFWMAWTARESISFWSSLAGSTLIGVSFMGSFIPAMLYLIDTFEANAASALAVAAAVRYTAAGVMVPVSIPMYKNLGVPWSLTLLGCIGLVLTPVPFALYWFGAAIRKRSRVASKKFVNV